MKPRVLVTGASGFVGGHIALDLAQCGFHVIASGGLHECPVEVRCAAEQFLSFDLQNPDSIQRLLEEAKPDAIVHAAALARPEVCEKDPIHTNIINVQGVKTLLSCIKNNLKKPLFIYVSTDLVFDGGTPPKGGFREEDEAIPRSIYSKSKREAELLVLEEHEYSLIARICLVYGPALGERHGFLSWIMSSLKESKPLTLFEDEFRTPVYTGDIGLVLSGILDRVEARDPHFMSLLNSSHPASRIFHVAGSETVSRYEFVKRLIQITGHSEELLVRSSLKTAKLSAPRAPDVSLSVEKLKKVLNIQTLNVNQGLRKLAPLLGI